MARSIANLQRLLLVSAIALLAGEAQAAGPAPFITTAVNNARRPAADRAQDGNRKPAELLAFFQIKQGQKVVDLLPGDGYFIRLLSVAVGPAGKVYVVGMAGAAAKVEWVTGSKVYANVQVVTASNTSLNLPEPVDTVWSAMSYHGLNSSAAGGGLMDRIALDRAVYRALKSGGHYVIIDNAANTGDANADSEHRVDQLTVVNEVAAAGFLKQSEIQTLRHPEDPRTADAESMNGTSDQFAMLMRKPDLTYGGAIHY